MKEVITLVYEKETKQGWQRFEEIEHSEKLANIKLGYIRSNPIYRSAKVVKR